MLFNPTIKLMDGTVVTDEYLHFIYTVVRDVEDPGELDE